MTRKSQGSSARGTGMRLPAGADDQAARDRIATDLDTNILVEAGAGSGKTTSLVGRMQALVARGTPVERIAAVTFTRKAANELRERFQQVLEEGVRKEPPGSERARLYDRALREMDRAFLGTIHSFCARLLRERPLEVALDPAFQEVTEEDAAELERSFWRRWVERAKRSSDPELAALRDIGVDVRTLYEGFSRIVTYPDVEFPLAESAAPDVEPCRRKLEALLAKARELLPREEPADGWDKLMQLVRRLERERWLKDWRSVAAFCAVLEGITASNCELTQKRWSDTRDGKAEAKRLSEEFLELLAGPIEDVLRCWREHRYPIVMRFLRRAAEEFERERHATGQLGFQDLLVLAATLLREHPPVRDELGRRYAHLLVDEFQDTDPIQAEVCFLLASDSEQGSDWRAVTPRPGSLFVVGDPKQSIYRFRRADIQIYELVRQRIAGCGAVLALTRNFRSVRHVEALVNEHFGKAFPPEATAVQAPFSRMHTMKESDGADGVYHYAVRPDGRKKDLVLQADAAMLASWIAERIARGERSAADFLVLTYRKAPIECYARALGERNVPVTTTGASLPQERELQELLIVLRAIAEPESPISVVAALEGLFFGLSPADLFGGRQAGIRFSLTHRPADEAHPVGRALLTLHEWWKLAQRHPPDVLVERILEETGLLFHAASQPLGDARAGALLHLVEVLRTASTAGASGMTDAMERIASVLNAEAADAPLRPGRLDAVRVMNLHKAKGLEADVVILAAPVDNEPHSPVVHVRRGEGDRPTGALLIQYRGSGKGGNRITIAQPPGWAALEAEESDFEAAERDRLLYVAVTRARRELLVARCERSNKSGEIPDCSMWSPLAESLTSLGRPLELHESPAPGRRRADHEPAALERDSSEAVDRVRTAAQPTVLVSTVTGAASQEREEYRKYDMPIRGAGIAWGRAVHRALEGMGRGRTGAPLQAFITAVARDEGLTEEQRGALERLMSEVERSDAWRRLTAHGTPQFELSLMQRSVDGDTEVLTEGVIDAAASNGDGWLVVDWKTDVAAEEVWRGREAQYARQVEQYASMLSALTGRPAHATIERVRVS